MAYNEELNNKAGGQRTQQQLLSNINTYLSGLIDADTDDTMPSPPPSSEFMFDTDGGGPADEIPLLIADARRSTNLTAALATVMATHKQLILDVFDRQIQLIKSRSQALEDGHVTVYDKALLALTTNGHDLENSSALLFWCENYLGIDNTRRPTETPKFLQEMMAVPTVINQAIAASSSHRLSGTTVKTEPDEFPEPMKFNNDATLPRLKRLWSIYEQARSEYLAVANKDDQNTITAAKFLRDTAENALAVLNDQNIDPTVLSELELTCKTAKDAVVTLSGGKKRKFDWSEKEKLKGSGSRGGRAGRAGTVRGGGARGRGHSGIPYGYARPVDSYHPY